MQPAPPLLRASAVVAVLAAGSIIGCGGSGTKDGHAVARSDPPLLDLTGGVGDIRLGDPEAKVEREYGTEGNGFKVTFKNSGLVSGYYRLHHGRVLVTFDGVRVSELDVRTPYYRTKGGVGLGSTIPLGRCHTGPTGSCVHAWHGFLWDAWVRQGPCSCWVKVGRGERSLPVTTKSFMKPWFFIDVHHGHVARFFFASKFVD